MPRLPKIEYSAFLVIVLLCIFLYVSFFVKPNVHYITSLMPNFQNSTNLLIAKAKFEGCYKEAAKIYYSDSNKFFAEFSQCIKTYIPITESHMDKIFNGAGNERKVFLPLAEDFPEEECTWLTIGIGGSEMCI
uniref:Uncharacterized protein n=1 Tax=Panagrolaimus davidi TaxID=227884 RepID=A0A914QXQ0_9BILA